MSQRFQRNQIYAILLLIREWAGEWMEIEFIILTLSYPRLSSN